MRRTGRGPARRRTVDRCIDEDGCPSWAFRTTEGLNDEELLGALTVRTDVLGRELLELYTDDDG